MDRSNQSLFANGRFHTSVCLFNAYKKVIIALDGNRTQVIWFYKQPLAQLCQNLCAQSLFHPHYCLFVHQSSLYFTSSAKMINVIQVVAELWFRALERRSPPTPPSPTPSRRSWFGRHRKSFSSRSTSSSDTSKWVLKARRIVLTGLEFNVPSCVTAVERLW